MTRPRISRQRPPLDMLERAIMRARRSLSPIAVAVLLVFVAAALWSLTGRIRSNQAPVASRFHAPITKDRPMSQCLSNQGLEDLISNTKQIFIGMQPKAAGMVLQVFVSKCMNAHMDNFINSPNRIRSFFTDSYQLPKVVSGHLSSDQPLLELIKQTTRDTLIIYVYRQETDRLLPAIRHVVQDRICKDYLPGLEDIDFNVTSNKGTCSLDELPLVDAIYKQKLEIGNSVQNSLTCAVYDAIQDNAPTMAFVNYKQVGQLQKIIAEHYCPGVLPEGPYHASADIDRTSDPFIRLKSAEADGKRKEVPLSEWLEEKYELMEWALDLKKGVECQAQTRRLEDDLLTCSDQALQVSSTV